MKLEHILILIATFITTLNLLVVTDKHFKKSPETPLTVELPAIIQPPTWSQSPTESPIAEPPKPTYEDAKNSITSEELKEMLYYISSSELGGRKSGSRGLKMSADYLENIFQEAGLKTFRHKFQYSGNNENVYAYIVGNEIPEEVVIIGAHYDSVGNAGADDNGSGTVAVVEVAEAFAMLKDRVKRTVVFQLYDAEERGLHGSRFYCKDPVFPVGSPSLGKHVYMLNLDMVGRLKQGQSVRSLLTAGSGASDHTSFRNASRGQIRTEWLFTGQHRDYHRQSDTAEKINYEGLDEISEFAFERLWGMCQN